MRALLVLLVAVLLALAVTPSQADARWYCYWNGHKWICYPR